MKLKRSPQRVLYDCAMTNTAKAAIKTSSVFDDVRYEIRDVFFRIESVLGQHS